MIHRWLKIGAEGEIVSAACRKRREAGGAADGAEVGVDGGGGAGAENIRAVGVVIAGIDGVHQRDCAARWCSGARSRRRRCWLAEASALLPTMVQSWRVTDPLPLTIATPPPELLELLNMIVLF